MIAGTGSNDTGALRRPHAARRDGRRRRRAGGHAVLQQAAARGLRAHFRAIAAATTLPVIIYNIPSRCVDQPAARAPGRPGHDGEHRGRQAGQPGHGAVAAAARAVRPGLYAGNDDMLLDVSAIGGRGGIWVASHIAGERMQESRRALVRAGDAARAARSTASWRRSTRRSSAPPTPSREGGARLLGQPVGGLRPPLLAARRRGRRAAGAGLLRIGVLRRQATAPTSCEQEAKTMTDHNLRIMPLGGSARSART